MNEVDKMLTELDIKYDILIDISKKIDTYTEIIEGLEEDISLIEGDVCIRLERLKLDIRLLEQIAYRIKSYQLIPEVEEAPF